MAPFSVDIGNSFLVGIYSAFANPQTAFVSLLIALFAAVIAAAAIHLWSWLWNTQWNGPVLILSKLLVFISTLAGVFLLIGISRVEDYISATALKLHRSLTQSAEWRQSAIREAYNQLEKSASNQALVSPHDGGDRIELRTNEDLRTFSDVVSKAASRAVAEASTLPVTADLDPSTTIAPDRSTLKAPVTVTPNNQWADIALDAAVRSWTVQARAWCNQQLGAFRTLIVLASAGIFVFVMVISAAGAWHDIAA